ncbi:MAG: protein translocase subunit SecF [Alphaproteobacteria bacterium]|nr:protein translocase subunit SecF [Alphaproteobacteria bacterium]
MRPIEFIPHNTRIDFVGRRLYAYVFSAVLTLASVLLFVFNGLNFGIDFRGGILIEVKTTAAADVATLRSTLGNIDLGEIQIQEFGSPDIVLIRIQRQGGDEAAQLAAISRVKESLRPIAAEYRRTEFVGPKFGSELIEAATLAVGLSLLAIMAYVWFRFEWQFGVAAVIALTHDVVTIIGLFALTEQEFNLSTVAAVLTVAGYSINDTVVVFDRVRENLRRYKRMPMAELLNGAINQTLPRTLMTSFTTLLPLLALVALGGPIIRDFSIAIIWGILIGTYSSVLVASPILLIFTPPRGAPTPEGEADTAAAREG